MFFWGGVGVHRFLELLYPPCFKFLIKVGSRLNLVLVKALVFLRTNKGNFYQSCTLSSMEENVYGSHFVPKCLICFLFSPSEARFFFES